MYGRDKQADEPWKRILVHGVDIAQVCNGKEQHCSGITTRLVVRTGSVDFPLRHFSLLLLFSYICSKLLGLGDDLNGSLVL